jgi:hypothetical protein
MKKKKAKSIMMHKIHHHTKKIHFILHQPLTSIKDKFATTTAVASTTTQPPQVGINGADDEDDDDDEDDMNKDTMMLYVLCFMCA